MTPCVRRSLLWAKASARTRTRARARAGSLDTRRARPKGTDASHPAGGDVSNGTGSGSRRAANSPPSNSTSFSVAHAILHRWTPMKALGQGRRLISHPSHSSFALPRRWRSASRRWSIIAVRLPGLSTWLAAARWRSSRWQPDFTDVRKTGPARPRDCHPAVGRRAASARVRALAQAPRTRRPAATPSVNAVVCAPLTVGLLPEGCRRSGCGSPSPPCSRPTCSWRVRLCALAVAIVPADVAGGPLRLLAIPHPRPARRRPRQPFRSLVATGVR